MPKNIPSLKVSQLIRLLEKAGCKYIIRILRQFGFTDEEIEHVFK
jgi:membrane carboxypeptidase/penicillin-binding protein